MAGKKQKTKSEVRGQRSEVRGRKADKKKSGRSENAATTNKEKMMSVEIRAVELAKIIPAAFNRRVNMKSPKMIELVASIKASGGNIVPGIARVHPVEADCVELCAGERRLKALEAGDRRIERVPGRRSGGCGSVAQRLDGGRDAGDGQVPVHHPRRVRDP